MGRGVRLTFKVKGAKVVRKGLENLQSEIPKVGRLNVWEFMKRVMKRMKIYPRKRPGQKYVRTFKLKRGWQLKKIGQMAYRLSNPTPYTKYVVGSAYGTEQAWMHVGRWKTLRDVSDEELKKLPEAIAKNLKTVSRRGGLKMS